MCAAQAFSVIDPEGTRAVRWTRRLVWKAARAWFARGADADQRGFRIGTQMVDRYSGLVDAAATFAFGVEVARARCGSVGTAARSVCANGDAEAPGLAIIVRAAARMLTP